MSGILRALTITILGMALFATDDARAGQANEYNPGELIVRFKPGARPQQMSGARLAGVVANPGKKVFTHLDMEHWTLPEGADLEETMRALRNSSAVEFVEPNYRRHLRVIDDACESQWALDDVKLTSVSPKPIPDASVKVGVIDTGVDPALEANLIAGWDVIDGDADTSPNRFDPVGWHGTAVASVIGATAAEVSGIAPGVQIVPIRTDFDVASLLEAYDVAIAKDVRVINASWGGPQFSIAEQKGIDLLEEHGILVVAAAGNYEVNNDLIPDYPSGLPNANIIAVAASDRSGSLTYWSQYGARDVDLAAPGEDIKVIVPVSKQANRLDCFSGTSFSAPHVAGLAALLMSEYPDDGLPETRTQIIAEVKARILTSAQPLASGGGLLATDGRMDAQAALAMSQQPAIVYAGHEFSDAEGNGNGLPEPGETLTLAVTLENLWVEAHNVSVTLTSDDPSLEVPGEEVVIGDFPVGAKAARFAVRLAPDAAGHHRIPLHVTVYADELGQPLVRRFDTEWGVLNEGTPATAIIQTHDQDDMNLWEFHVAPGTGRIRVSLDSGGSDLDLMVRKGGVPQFDWYYCERKSSWWCAEKGTRVSNGDASEESVVIDTPEPGVYYASVINFGQTRTTYRIGVHAGSNGGGGGAGIGLVVLAGLVLLLRTGRRLRSLGLITPLLVSACAGGQQTVAQMDPTAGQEFLITFADHMEREDALAQLQGAGVEILRVYEHLPIFHIRTPAGMTAEQAQIHLRQLPDVIAVEPNLRRHPYIDP